MSAEWFQVPPYQVRVWPDDPSLRLVAKPVERFDDPDAPESERELRRLVVGMGNMMIATHGVGLAAPQVGVQRRVCVLKERKVADGTPMNRPQKEIGAYAFVNPRVVDRLDGEEYEAEGCLSLPGLMVTVPRAVRVVVEHYSTFGEKLLIELRGYEARIAQHEIDHLDGKLILDYLEPADLRRVMMEMAELRRMAEREREWVLREQLAAAVYAAPPEAENLAVQTSLELPAGVLP